MENSYVEMLLALAVIAVPLGMAGLLVELRSRRRPACSKERKDTTDAD